MLDALIRLGLSDKEASVYLAVLELGEDTVQNIAQKSGVKRVTTYVILEKLLKLGLVSSVERGRKSMFIAENPSELSNLLEEQRRDVEAKAKELDGLTTQLQAVYNANSDKPIVRYFEGPDGLEALDRYGIDQFKQGSEILGISPIDIVEDRFSSRRRSAVNERVKRKIGSRVIYTHKNGEIPGFDANESLRESAYLPREAFPLDATIQIYPDWGVKFFNYREGEDFGVLVQSPDLARNMKLLFELAWNNVKKESPAAK